MKETPSSLAKADVMVGDVVISGSTASVNLVRQICVFRLTVTCATTAYGTVKYTLNDFYSSDLNTNGGQKTQVFYAPIFFDGDLEVGYTVNFLYGGRSKEGWGASWENVETFGGGCQQHASVTEKRTLEKGKIYGFTMTI